MKIKCRKVVGTERYEHEFQPTSTIADVREWISAELKISDFKLLLATKELKDTDVLNSLRIRANTVIVIYENRSKPQPPAPPEPKPIIQQDLQISIPFNQEIILPPRSGPLVPGNDPENFLQMVSQLQDLGFEKKHCEDTLRAASYNLSIAADALFSGLVLQTPSQPDGSQIREFSMFQSQISSQPQLQQTRIPAQIPSDLTIEERDTIASYEKQGYDRATVIQVFLACERDLPNVDSCLKTMK